MEPRNDRLDRWLDTALREYGQVESRPGLEGRILASLASETVSAARSQRWWRWASAGVAMVAGLVLWLEIGPPTQKTESKVAVDARRIVPRAAPDIGPSATASSVGTATAQTHRRAQPGKTTKVARVPRQDQFPSLRPLSEQEQLLLRYAREFPKEAAEMAQAQASAEAQREREELATENNSGKDSDHPSR